jgi:LuxR family quorum sensing-dependent transcriptional regulator
MLRSRNTRVDMPAFLAATVLDLVGHIAAEKTVPGVWTKLQTAAHHVGFSFGLACFLPGDHSLDVTTFASTLPSGVLQNYAANGYQAVDPLIERSMGPSRSSAWKLGDWEDTALPLRRRWMDDNRAAGLSAGILITDHSDGIPKVINLCGPNTDLRPQQHLVLHLAGLEALLRMREIGLRLSDAPLLPLSAREVECLQWVGAGKSDWDISVILSISEKSVNAYIERAKHKLGVTSRAQALVMALRHHLIRP